MQLSCVFEKKGCILDWLLQGQPQIHNAYVSSLALTDDLVSFTIFMSPPQHIHTQLLSSKTVYELGSRHLNVFGQLNMLLAMVIYVNQLFSYLKKKKCFHTT